MTSADSLAIVSSTVASVEDNFSVILPYLLPFVVTVLVLYFAWRKIRSLL